MVLQFLKEDLKSNIDIALAWLYEEYSYLQGFATTSPIINSESSHEEKYNKLFCSLTSHVMNLHDPRERDR